MHARDSFATWFAAIAAIVSIFSHSTAFADWYLVGEHYHTTTGGSYSRAGLVELLKKGEAAGLDAMIVTEHNTVATCFDPLFADRSHKVTLICGEEWTTQRSIHLGLFNPPVAGPSDAFIPTKTATRPSHEFVQDDARAVIEKIHLAAAERGQVSLAVINHPGMAMYQPSDSLGADAVEAMVPFYESPWGARRWWLHRLAAGQKMVALGGSDYHACDWKGCLRRGDVLRRIFDEPVNLVQAKSTTTSDILEAIARGRVVALANASYRNIRVDFTSEMGGVEYQMGDSIPEIEVSDWVRFRVLFKGAEGLRAVVYQGARAIRTLNAGQTFDVLKASSSEAVHIEFFKGKGRRPPVAITNPIYF